jgi:hypothetical protein
VFQRDASPVLVPPVVINHLPHQRIPLEVPRPWTMSRVVAHAPMLAIAPWRSPAAAVRRLEEPSDNLRADFLPAQNNFYRAAVVF